MTPATLRAIIDREGQTIDQFARRLGKGRNAISRYLHGTTPIPNYIALAATAIHMNIEPLE